MTCRLNHVSWFITSATLTTTSVTADKTKTSNLDIIYPRSKMISEFLLLLFLFVTTPFCLCDAQAPRCPAFARLRQGLVVSSGNEFNDTTTFLCNFGFTRFGSQTRRCRANGAWDGKKARCGRVCKDPGKNSNSQRDQSPKQYFKKGQHLTYYCNRNFATKDNLTLTCQNDGTWSSKPPVCLAKCSDPSLKTNANVVGNKFYHGESLYFSCPRRDYRLVPRKSRKLKCHRGKWNGEIPTCKAPCRRLVAPSNGRITHDRYKHGETTRFTCNYGYKLVGHKRRRCNHGQWTGNKATTCEVVVCPEPGAPRNGYMVKGRRRRGDLYTFLSTVFFSCHNGYILAGNPGMVCLGGGRWSGLPNCLRAVSCVTPVGDNGKKIVKHGETAKFTCPRGKELVGLMNTKEATCYDGVWKQQGDTIDVAKVKCLQEVKPKKKLDIFG